MARPKDPQARQRIIAAVRLQVARYGVEAWTLQSVADQLKITKQAVLHHFGSKQALFRALVVEEIGNESAAIQQAVSQAANATEVVARCIRATVQYHLADLDRFRLIYTAVQGNTANKKLLSEADRIKYIYPASNALYSALEQAIVADPTLRPQVHARRLAVAVHLAALGIVCYIGMLDAVKGKFSHSTNDIVEELVHSMTHGITAAG